MTIGLKVRDVMDRNVMSIGSDSTVADVIQRMVQGNVWSLVVEKRGLPQGVVTERDVLRRCLGKGLAPDRMTVEKIASSPLVTIGPDATIREAMDMMVNKNIRRLFVVENGKIVGRITQTLLFKSTFEVMTTIASLSNQL